MYYGVSFAHDCSKHRESSSLTKVGIGTPCLMIRRCISAGRFIEFILMYLARLGVIALSASVNTGRISAET